jgi:cbb3-type cytochrome oxidase maturation protein
MSENDQVTKKSNGGYIAVIILLLLGLGVMSYLWSSKNGQLNDCKNDNAMLNADMNGMNEMLSGYVGNMSNDLKTDFKNMLETYDALLEKDASKADSINKQKEEIQKLLTQVESGKLTARQLFLARKEIETLRGIMKGYIYQIDSLNTLNLKLTYNLDSTKTVLNTTTSERDKYKTDAEKRAEQLKVGSKLNAYGFTSEGLKEKLNSTKTPTDRARSVVQIRSSFTLSKNPITPAGSKTVYMQIIDPSGKVMQSSSNVAQMDNGQIAYSDKKDVDYNNESVDLSIYYSLRGEEAEKGNYKVNIYCQGQLIGSDSFTLK